MNRLIPVCTFAAAIAFAVSLGAQETTVKSKTTVDADDAHVVTMTGCLKQGSTGELFVLSNATMVKGDDMKSESKTTIDVDERETEVKEKATTEVEHDKPVGTAGAVTTYELSPHAGVDLTAHVGQKVELTAIALDAAKGDAAADVTIKAETKVRREDAPDAKMKTETKAELARGANPRLSVLSVKMIAATCPM